MRQPFKSKRQNGFTLIEVIMSIVILGIVAVVAGLLIFEGTRSFGEMDKMSGLGSQSALAAGRMTREMTTARCSNITATRCLPTASDITMMTATEVRFVNLDNEGRGFRLDAATGTIRLRQGVNNGDPEEILCDKVSALNFAYLDRNDAQTALATDVWTILVDMTLTDANQAVPIRVRAHPKAFVR